MRIYRDASSCPASAHGAVIALGNFDGVHPGHLRVLGEAKTIAKSLRAPFAVMTFMPHPRRFFDSAYAPVDILSFRSKATRLFEAGVEHLFVMRFNRAFADITAEEFVENILVGNLRVQHVVTGEDFAFGKGRVGNASMLMAEARKCGFGYTAIQKERDAISEFSSRRIREALRAGNMQQVAELMGRFYAVEGHVIHGDKRGRDLGFPTANLSMRNLFSPAFGVYAARMRVAGEDAWRAGVANIGVRPSFGGGDVLLEIHLLNDCPMLYGKRVCVELMSYLRAEQKFESVERLKEQIAKDCKMAREFHLLALKQPMERA